VETEAVNVCLQLEAWMKAINGVYPAIVTDNADPENSGRVKVRLPAIREAGMGGSETWARIATLMAGKNRGTWFIPDIKDEVLIAFEAGDPGRPYVIGALWNGANPPPATTNTDNNRKLLRSRSGITITLDDRSGQENFIVETPGGQKFTLKDGPGAVEITDSNGNSVKLETGGITVTASAKVTIRASSVEISASAVNVNAAMSKFAGVVHCDTLISNSVISASYSPGAGNVW
jgi:uncharacterized protein involved in type VI secretion and phage assembly